MRYSFSLLLFFFYLPIFANPTEDDLSELSLEELLEVKVSIASKVDEPISMAPGLVSTYSRETLKNLGVRNLREILSLFTGFVVNDSLGGDTPIQIRGLADFRNQKILFLLNDTPYWFAGDGKIPVGDDIHFDLIERVEVIRGPGSVIYGTKASAGVIKVITRKDLTTELSGELNNFGGYGINAYQTSKIGEDSTLTLSASIEEQNYSDIEVANSFGIFDPATNTFPQNQDGTFEDQVDRKTLFASYINAGFEATAHFLERSKTLAINNTILSPGIQDHQSILANLSYTLPLSLGTIKTFADYNSYDIEARYKNLYILSNQPEDGELEFVNGASDNFRTRFGIQGELKISDTFSILSGIETENRYTGDYLYKDYKNGEVINGPNNGIETTPGYNALLLHGKNEIFEHSVFSQFQYHDEQLKIVAGGRYIDNEFGGEKLTPRLSIILGSTSGSSYKILYAQGFNSPTFGQNSIVTGIGTTRTEKVGPEENETLELEYTYKSERWTLNLSAFQSHIDNVIGTKDGFTQNLDGYYHEGLESQFMIQGDRWNSFFNFSYLLQGNSVIEGNPGAYHAPKYSGNWSGIYRYSQAALFGFRTQYIGKRSNVDPSMTLSINTAYDFGKLRLDLIVNNLTEEVTSSPDVGLWRILTLTEGNREMILKLTYNAL